MTSNETFVPAALLPDFGPNSSFGESYELIRELGRGGMAIVYLVRERATGLERAVKVIHTKFVDDQEALARFDREARLVAQLEHPNIVATHSVQWIDGVGFGLVMDHVRGRTLKQILADGAPIPFDQAARVLDDIAAALGFAHMHGIVHRDVKPENIFIEETSGHALLADFGIARSVQTETLLTLAGAAIGTPTYMAPEQIDGGAPDARSDLYSLGLVGWEMLTGRRPWDGESLYNVIYRQKHDQLAAIDALRPDTPIALVCAIEGLLEKSPAARWQTAADFRAQLNSSEPPVRRLHDTGPAPDATVMIPVPVAKRVRGPLRRLAPIGAAAALLLSATLLFARPAPSWVPLVSRHADPAPQKPVAPRRPSRANVATAPIVTPVPAAQPDSAGIQGLASSSVAGSAGALVYPSPASAEDVVGESTRVPSDLIAPMQRVTSSSTIPQATPNVVHAPASPPVGGRFGEQFALAAGGTHTCLIASNGTTYCWGANNAGQLGTGATQTRATPAEVSGTARFSSIAPGLSHTCALTARGSLYCWGNNESGQLGDGSHSGHDTPARVAGSPALTSVVSGAGFSCGLTNDGQALCWGAGSHGQIGDGAKSERTTPATVSTRITFASLAAGWNHVCALSENGAAYCWGANDDGELGDGTNSDRSTPTPVHTTLRFTSLSAGAGHTCGTTSSGTIYCWGDNRYGQLGDGGHAAHTTPVAVASSEHFVAVSTGSVHTCGLTQNHDALCWGRNTYGQLGDGSAVSQSSPVQVAGGHSFTSVTAFGSHTCGATTSAELFCWGYNLDGELGDGTREHRLRPTYIDKPVG
jgi:serine/threonine protein kinase/alpha-tubulin suppressor-like RCC1 family protein